MMKILLAAVLLAGLAFPAAAVHPSGKERIVKKQTFFVAPSVKEQSGDGSAARPFGTLTEARDAIRRQKDASTAFEVVIKPGTYAVKETLTLDEADSGTAEAPVEWRAEKAGTVHFYCGAEFIEREVVTDPAVLARLRPEARGKVWQCSLKRAGVIDPGEMRERGFASYIKDKEIATVEFYCGGKRMELSRYPKTGFLVPKSLVQAGKVGGETSILEYDSPCHERWKDADDLWLYGYFHWRWADARIKVAKIDTEKHWLVMDHAYSYSTIGTMSTEQGIIYRAVNLLEELSEAGEWYLDRKGMMLYFIAPEGIDAKTAKLEMSLFNGSPVVLQNVRHVTLKGLHFDLGRSIALRMKNCSDCVIDGCAFTRFGATAVLAPGSKNCAFRNCEIARMGRGGLAMSGGERETLMPSGNVIENNRIHDFGCIDSTYVPAFSIDGVGFRISHNLLYNCPSSVIRLEGNDHVFEYNEVHSAVRESDDQGAVDIYQNPTYRGTVFRYNYFHDIGRKPSKGLAYVCGSAGIRLDDVISGYRIYGNVFVRASSGHFGAVQMNCGRDNLIENNLFLDGNAALSGGFGPWHHEYKEIAEGKPKFSGCYMTELYFKRYPALKNLTDGKGVNTFRRNIVSGCRTVRVGQKPNEKLPYFEEQNNLFIPKLDQSIEEAMAEGVKAIGFEPIPFKEIGLTPDESAAWNTYGEPTAPAVPLPSWEKQPASGTLNTYGEGELSPEWHVFGPLPQGCAAQPDLTSVPERIEGKTAQIVQSEEGVYDLAELSPTKKEHEVFWIYMKLTSPKDGPLTLGAGFDYWGKIWIDGEQVFDTGAAGNVLACAHADDHIFTVPLKAGGHIVAVRQESGSDEHATLAFLSGQSFVRSIYRELWWLDPAARGTGK